MRTLIAGLAVLAGAAVSQVRIVTVDDDRPADFATIQAAIDDANDGDTVEIQPGTYTGDGNRDISFRGKAVTVRSLNGPEDCIIDCQGSEAEPHRGFLFHNWEDSNSILDGFTITNGYDQVCGGGIHCGSGSPTIQNCIITNNRAGDDGGGIMCSVASPTIRNCIITRNIAEVWEGGAIRCHACTGAVLDNCLITENSARFGGGIGSSRDNSPRLVDVIVTNCTFSANSAQYGGAVYVRDGSEPFIVNSILWGDTALYGPEIALEDFLGPAAFLHVSFSDVQGGEADVYNYGYLYWEVGNIDADPCFADRSNGDYHLKSQAGRWDASEERWTIDEVTSPCIDAGEPMSPIGYEPFPNGAIINMGAYGGTAEASKSYFGEPICETIIAGDINGDCAVSFDDFALMALGGTAEASKSYFGDPPCKIIVAGDINRDCAVNLEDFALMALHWLEQR